MELKRRIRDVFINKTGSVFLDENAFRASLKDYFDDLQPDLLGQLVQAHNLRRAGRTFHFTTLGGGSLQYAVRRDMTLRDVQEGLCRAFRRPWPKEKARSLDFCLEHSRATNFNRS